VKLTYKLAILQPTGRISQTLFHQPTDGSLQDTIEFLIADYREYLQYEDTLHYTLYLRKANSQAFDIIEEDTHVLQYPLF
jgi:hypothetical protein